MCGIAGKVTFDRGDSIQRDVVANMTAALAHRGPDGSCFHFGPCVAFGYRRLNAAVEPGERQPVSSQDAAVWVMVDGEIYNARDLRLELEGRGRVFAGRSGAEVIVQGYEQWGDEMVARLRGPFAFALWDSRQLRLLLGRDRLGIRPLHYSLLDGHGLAFASEIKALLRDPDVSLHWDPSAITEYMALGWVPSPATVFSRIVKVPPGHLLVASRGRVRVTQYWDLVFHPEDRSRDEREYVQRLDGLLRETMAVHARGAGSLAAVISSGLGSAAVVSYLSEGAASPPVTTCAGFDAPPFDEVQRARALAKHHRTRHCTELVTPDVSDLLPRLAWHFDEPFGDPSAVTAHYTMAAARAHAPVAIAPFGADEIWSGGARHRSESMEATARRWLGPLRFGARMVAPLVPVCSSVVTSARRLALPSAEAYARRHARLLPRARATRRLYAADFARQTGHVDAFASIRSHHERCGSTDPIDRALYTDVKAYLANDLLTKVDRLSAESALLVRLPMLDHASVEFSATVPSGLKVRHDRSRCLLHRLLETRMPAHLLRPSRHPFEPPAAAWLRGPLAPMASDLLLSGRFRQRGIFDHHAVRDVWQAHLTGRADHHNALWSLLMLELWFERFVDGTGRHRRAA